jgi:Domain of unknown function (DUF4349)
VSSGEDEDAPSDEPASSELECPGMSKTKVRAIGAVAIVGFLALAALLFSGGSISAVLSTVGSSIGSGGAGPALPVAKPGSNGTTPQDQSSQTGSGTGTNTKPVLYDPGTPNLQIIKTGTLGLQVTAIDGALADASQKITALGGYASGSQRVGDGDQAQASVTYRIPAPKWDDALVALRGIATKVLGEETKTEDVTTQIVDLSARITNLEATEAALQGIMLKATKISDILAVQAQLTDTRGQIEQATGERKHLTEQSTYSTLTVTYSLKEQAVVATTKKFDPTTEVDRASANLVEVFQSLETTGIWFGIVWLPILVGVGIIGLVFAAILRRILRPRPGAGLAAEA